MKKKKKSKNNNVLSIIIVIIISLTCGFTVFYVSNLIFNPKDTKKEVVKTNDDKKDNSSNKENSDNKKGIEVEYQSYDSKILDYEKVEVDNSNVIFAENEKKDQVVILNSYDEYSSFQKKNIDEMLINGTSVNDGFKKDLDIAKREYNAKKAAVVIYYNNFKTYDSEVYVNDNVLYLNSTETLLSDQFEEEKLKSYKSRADVYFLDKALLKKLSKVVIVKSL